MGAAEDEGVDALGEERVEVAAEHLVGDGILDQAFLDEGNEERAGSAVDCRAGFQGEDGFLVSAAGDGRAGADDADGFVFGRIDGGFGSGNDDADDGDFEDLFHAGDAEGRGGVAGDDDHFGASGEKKISDLDAVALDGFAAFSTVGNARGVADVEDVFVREEAAQAGGDGEASDAGVENADGLVVGGASWHSGSGKVFRWPSF